MGRHRARRKTARTSASTSSTSGPTRHRSPCAVSISSPVIAVSPANRACAQPEGVEQVAGPQREVALQAHGGGAQQMPADTIT